MSDPSSEQKPSATPVIPSNRRRRVIRGLKIFAAIVVLWLLTAYLILPALWRHYEHHPSLEDAPKTTLTAQGIAGDPLNVGLVGTEKEVVDTMLGAGWDPANPTTLKSSIKIADSVLLGRPYSDAPVSNLFLFGRKQDLAFEKPFGHNARKRNHVRFWRFEGGEERGGAPFWIGAATFDRSVGFSHRTGQITHHIASDIDAERDGLFRDLAQSGRPDRLFQVTGVGATLPGRNGGGDRYYTDGELTIGVLGARKETGRVPEVMANPPAVQIKDQLWNAIRPLLQSLSGP